MSEDPGDLEQRVQDLETEVDLLNRRVQQNKQDAAAARILAGGADRDVGELREEVRDFRRATTASFNALRTDFTDLKADFTDLKGQMNDGFTEIRGRLDATAAGIAQIAEMLATLIDDGNAKSS